MEEIDLSELSEAAMQQLAELIAEIKLPEVTYAVMYDPVTGEVKSVGPSEAFTKDDYTIPIDEQTAIDIIESRININHCFVDLDSSELEIVESRNVFKIDDILHRVPLAQWSEIEKSDIYISYYPAGSKLVVQLSEEFHGTKKLPEKFKNVHRRRTRWSGDTNLIFFVTEYNDPHAIKEIVTFKIDDLIGSTKIINNIVLPKRFSIFTRRIFKNYVMDIK